MLRQLMHLLERRQVVAGQGGMFEVSDNASPKYNDARDFFLLFQRIFHNKL